MSPLDTVHTYGPKVAAKGLEMTAAATARLRDRPVAVLLGSLVLGFVLARLIKASESPLEAS
jgi:hypothetical protein